MPHYDHVTNFELMRVDALRLGIPVRKVGSSTSGATTTGLVVDQFMCNDQSNES